MLEVQKNHGIMRELYALLQRRLESLGPAFLAAGRWRFETWSTRCKTTGVITLDLKLRQPRERYIVHSFQLPPDAQQLPDYKQTLEMHLDTFLRLVRTDQAKRYRV